MGSGAVLAEVSAEAELSPPHIERGRALRPQTAISAFSAAPDTIEARLRGVQQHVVVGADAEFEIAPPLPFGTQARAGEVGAAQIQIRAVDRDHLQVHARAMTHL